MDLKIESTPTDGIAGWYERHSVQSSNILRRFRTYQHTESRTYNIPCQDSHFPRSLLRIFVPGVEAELKPLGTTATEVTELGDGQWMSRGTFMLLATWALCWLFEVSFSTFSSYQRQSHNLLYLPVIYLFSRFPKGKALIAVKSNWQELESRMTPW